MFQFAWLPADALFTIAIDWIENVEDGIEFHQVVLLVCPCYVHTQIMDHTSDMPWLSDNLSIFSPFYLVIHSLQDVINGSRKTALTWKVRPKMFGVKVNCSQLFTFLPTPLGCLEKTRWAFMVTLKRLRKKLDFPWSFCQVYFMTQYIIP